MRMRAFVVAAGVVLAVAGCSAEVVPQAQLEPTSVSAAPSTAPITVGPGTPSPSATTNPYGEYTQDEFYIKSVRSWAWKGSPVTDEQLLSAAQLVCDKLTKGEPRKTVRVVEGSGEAADWDNSRIVNAAVQVYCPAFR